MVQSSRTIKDNHSALSKLLNRVDELSSPQEDEVARLPGYDVSGKSFGGCITDEQHVSRLREALIQEARTIIDEYASVLDQAQASLQKEIDKLFINQREHNVRVKRIEAQAARLDDLVARQPLQKAIDEMLKGLRIMEQVSTPEAPEALHREFQGLCTEHEASEIGSDHLDGLETLHIYYDP